MQTLRTLTAAPSFQWSYTKLSCFEQCPCAFKLKYLDSAPTHNNAFAEYGSYCHAQLERFHNGELTPPGLAPAYREGYDQAITHAFPPFPKGMAAKYFDQGLAYFAALEKPNVTVFMNEERFSMEIGGHPFTGIVDLLVMDDATGEMILIDHKSKSLRTIRKEKQAQQRQLYLYASYVEAQMGLPDKIAINAFREQEMITLPFDADAYALTMDWISETIARILTEEAWPHKEKPDYFCSYICSVYDSCPLVGY